MMDPPKPPPLSKPAEAWAHPVVRHLIMEKVEEASTSSTVRRTLSSILQLNWACFNDAAPRLYRKIGGFRGYKIRAEDACEADLKDGKRVGDYIWCGGKPHYSLLHYMEQAGATEARTQFYISKVKFVKLPYPVRTMDQVDIPLLRKTFPSLRRITYTFTHESFSRSPIDVALCLNPATNNFDRIWLDILDFRPGQDDVIECAIPLGRAKTVSCSIEELKLTGRVEVPADTIRDIFTKLSERGFSFGTLRSLEIGRSGLEAGSLADLLEKWGRALVHLRVQMEGVITLDGLEDVIQQCPIIERLHIKPQHPDMWDMRLSEAVAALQARRPQLQRLSIPVNLYLENRNLELKNPFLSSVRPGADVFPSLEEASFHLIQGQCWDWSQGGAVRLASHLFSLFPSRCQMAFQADGSLWEDLSDPVGEDATDFDDWQKEEELKNDRNFAAAETFALDLGGTVVLMEQWASEVVASREAVQPGWKQLA